MITGAAQMDGAIVVVAASDSVMNQTKEHLLLAKQVGVKHLVVFINKADLSDPETLKLVEADIRGNLAEHGYDGEKTPIVTGSALCTLEGRNPEIGKDSINKLLEAIDNHIPIPERDEGAPFSMSIEDVFTISGRGTIVTGKVNQGTLQVGEEVEISGLGNKTIKTVATSIEMHHKELEKTVAGDSVGIRVRGVERDQVTRGQVLTKPSKSGEIKVYDKFVARAYILSKEERGRHTSFRSGYRPQFYFRTADVTGTITLTNKDAVVEPGNTVDFTVELIKPVTIEAKENFVIREGNHTIGQGTVIELIK
jgi:elongation factor Tu